MTEELQNIRKSLSKVLKKDRYEHTIGVMYTASALAMRYQEDIQRALTAGLLHDCGKFASGSELIRRCRHIGISLTASELEMPALIHAKYGAYLAKHEYGITDEMILNAVRYHTTGRPDMTMLEKIIYIADYIEPNRKVILGLTDVRTAAFEDIDRAVCMSASATVHYLQKSGLAVDPMTIDTYEYYRKERSL